jgi:hypothetical protein
MGKKIILIITLLFVFIGCTSNTSTPEKQLVGAPTDARVDERAEKVIKFIRESNPDLGEVTRYRRQVVNGINHHFEFTKYGKLPMEITVYEDLDGNYKIMSKGVLE